MYFEMNKCDLETCICFPKPHYLLFLTISWSTKQKKCEDNKEVIKSVNRKRTDNTMAKRVDGKLKD